MVNLDVEAYVAAVMDNPDTSPKTIQDKIKEHTDLSLAAAKVGCNSFRFF